MMIQFCTILGLPKLGVTSFSGEGPTVILHKENKLLKLDVLGY